MGSYANKRGILIALVGLDGSGKTTLARWLQLILEQRGYRVAYVHFWPALRLSCFAHLTQQRFQARVQVRTEPKGLSRWRAWTLYVFITLGLLRWRLPQLLRSYEVVLSDRYVPDLAAYLTLQGHKTLAQRLLSQGKHLQPDVLFWLRIRPERLRKRKPTLEHSPDVYWAWDALQGNLLQEYSHVKILNADVSPEEVREQALRVLEQQGLL